MKIVAVSDTHRRYNEIPKMPSGDLLVFAGDDDWRTKSSFMPFLEWFSSHPHKYKVMIAGNHDFFAENNKDFIVSESEKRSVIYLENSGIEIEGFKIWGSPYTPTFGPWAFMKLRGNKISEIWNLIPKNTDILITHGPPMFKLDMTPRGESVGCWDLANIIDNIKPRVHIYGHIHNCYGRKKEKDIVYVNASVVSEQYQYQNKPQVISIK